MTVDYIRDRITQLRLEKEVSEYKMSYELGHSRGYINNISSGKTLPSMTEFLAICDYFGISPMDFFQEELKSPCRTRDVCAEVSLLSDKDLRLVQQLIQRLNSL